MHSCDINLFCDKDLLGGMITFSDSSSLNCILVMQVLSFDAQLTPSQTTNLRPFQKGDNF